MNVNNPHIFVNSPYKLRFSWQYSIKSLCCLAILILIALYVRDTIIRPYIGDVLVIVWVYFCLATLIQAPVKLLAIASVLIGFIVEFAQYFHLAETLNLEPNSALHVILGATFDTHDLMAYTLGGICCWAIEKLLQKKSPKEKSHGEKLCR
ncbi:MAG: DUF2809 domain-containing protein [Vibrio sp.]